MLCTHHNWFIQLLHSCSSTPAQICSTCTCTPLHALHKFGSTCGMQRFSDHLTLYQCAVCSVQCAVAQACQCAVCSVQCEACSVQCAVCSVLYVVCSVVRTRLPVHCTVAVCSVHCTVCSVQCGACNVQRAVCCVQLHKRASAVMESGAVRPIENHDLGDSRVMMTTAW